MCRLSVLLFLIVPAISVAAGDIRFKEVTKEVVNYNPPGLGNYFDYAFVDANDDGFLDILINNHHHNRPSPVFLGTEDYKFRFWKNLEKGSFPHAGFWLGEVDLDGNNKTDLVYTGNEGGVVINLNLMGDGSRYPVYDSVHIKRSSPLVNFADFNGDGQLETLLRPGLIYSDIRKKPDKQGVFFGIVAISDFNNDGWPDLIGSGNKGRWEHFNGPRQLYKNQQGVLQAVEIANSDIGSRIGGIVRTADFNNDGNMDIYFFYIAPKNKFLFGEPSMQLFLGNGDFTFRNHTKPSRLSKSDINSNYSHVYLIDIDNDADVDILSQSNLGTELWLNDGNAIFTRRSNIGMPWSQNKHLRFEDYDRDGKLDVVTGGAGASWEDRKTAISVFRNTSRNKNRWLKIKVRQDDGNTMAIGAAVTLYDSAKGNMIGKQLVQSDTMGLHPRLHFGLGKVTKVDIEVLFPSTKERKRFNGVESNQHLILYSDGRVSKN